MRRLRRKAHPSDYFQFICKSRPKENTKGLVDFNKGMSSYSWTACFFSFLFSLTFFLCCSTPHKQPRHFFLWVDVILWSTPLILQKGADVPDPAWLPWGPPTLLEQMCSAIVNRHVCLSPSYYSRRMINRLITQKHQCKATEQ